jgi:hypothetical protein
VWLILDTDRAPLDQRKDQAEQQHTQSVDLLPIELVVAKDSMHSDQTSFTELQPTATQIQGTATSHAPSSPRQLSGSPDHPVFKDSGRRAGTVPERESSQTHEQYQFTAQNMRTIESVTIDPIQIQHFFTVYVSPPPARRRAEDLKGTSHTITLLYPS